MSELNEGQDLDEVLPKGKIPQNRLQMRGPSKFGQFGKQTTSDLVKQKSTSLTNQNEFIISENNIFEESKQKAED